ncbi:flagellar basal body L-ring protein FlgH [Mesorhizobium sp. ZMM04-5]|uniref:Flagellar L-ring protein n=1 Tax=Mesorhizobium marinum TaxID=3228790 RepID=A0ABV3QTV0_9HYPH
MIRAGILLLATSLLAGCGGMREIGVEPELSPVGAGLVGAPAPPVEYAGYPPPPQKRFSLWNDRQSRLFTDPRALSPGDILTVRISINDRARFKNESDRKRTASRSLGGAIDYEWDGLGSSGSADASVNSSTAAAGDGETKRSEDLELSIAAVVVEVLGNGNLVIQGSQEVRVNAELRILTIGGIVRPIDIGPQNTIAYERIAEARISYGGRGRLTEVQQPPYGQQILDRVLPF